MSDTGRVIKPREWNMKGNPLTAWHIGRRNDGDIIRTIYPAAVEPYDQVCLYLPRFPPNAHIEY